MPSAPKFNGDYVAGESGCTIPVILRNTSDNRETTGVASGSVTAWYWREGKTPISITMTSLASLTAAHSGGGWYQVSASNFPGLYRFDIPDSAISDEDGVNFVTVCVQVSGCYAFFKSLTFETRSRTALYSELTHATYGLPRLVRAVLPANPLNIDASGIAYANVLKWVHGSPLTVNAFGEVPTYVARFDANGTSELAAAVESLLSTSTRTEPAAGAPPDLPTIVQMLQYLYMGFKNKLASTNDTLSVHNKDGAELMKATLSDDGTTFTRAKFGAP